MGTGGPGAPAPAELGCAGSPCREGIPGEQSDLQPFVLPEPRCAHVSASPLGNGGMGMPDGGTALAGAAGDEEKGAELSPPGFCKQAEQ